MTRQKEKTSQLRSPEPLPTAQTKDTDLSSLEVGDVFAFVSDRLPDPDTCGCGPNQQWKAVDPKQTYVVVQRESRTRQAVAMLDMDGTDLKILICALQPGTRFPANLEKPISLELDLGMGAPGPAVRLAGERVAVKTIFVISRKPSSRARGKGHRTPSP